MTLTPATDADWLVVLLDTDQNAKTGHLGYDYRLNHTRRAPDSAGIKHWNAKAWEPTGTAILQVGTSDLHLAAERTALSFAADKPLRFGFKWTDKVPANAEAIDFLDQGDTAPNARFNYHYLAPRSP